MHFVRHIFKLDQDQDFSRLEQLDRDIKQLLDERHTERLTTMAEKRDLTNGLPRSRSLCEIVFDRYLSRWALVVAEVALP